MVAPFEAGAVHLIVTVSGVNDVTGATGVEGAIAARIDTAVELAPYIIKFLAYTINV